MPIADSSLGDSADSAAPGPAGQFDAAPRRADSVPRPWLGVAALLLCAAMWSLNGPLIKLLHADQVAGITIACYRSLIGGLVFLPLAWSRRGSLRRVAPGWPIFAVLTFTLMTATFVIATTKTAAANAIVLQYTSPIWVFLLAPLLLQERPGWAEGLALLIAMAGVGVIFHLLAAESGAAAGSAPGGLAGPAIALLSGLGYGALTVALRGLRPVNPLVVAAMNALGSGLLLFVPVGLWGRPPGAGAGFWDAYLLGGREWALVLFLGLVQFTLPYVLFSWALQRVEAHRAALIVLLETVLNPLWTYLLVGERIPRATQLGGPLILVGVVGWLLLSWRRERRTAMRESSAAALARGAGGTR